VLPVDYPGGSGSDEVCGASDGNGFCGMMKLAVVVGVDGQSC
jgi:hypothetical protein